jgi:hypothetical protein
MKPCHHWMIHHVEQLRDYGTSYEIWCYLTERLNKLFKGYNTNSSTHGQMEAVMMRAFMRNIHLDNLVSRQRLVPTC